MKVEIFTTKTKPFPKRKFPGFHQEKENTWSAYMSAKEAKRAVKRASSCNLRARMYEERFERSPEYRQNFIKANPPENGKYRCVYCGRVIRSCDMEVDHILPVAAAKKSKKIQRKLRGKKGVNRLSNLVPSCHRCNMRKLDSTAIWWRIKARLGRHKMYWAMRYVCMLLLVIVVVAYVSRCDFSYADSVGREVTRNVGRWLDDVSIKIGLWLDSVR